jgi:mRNA-degrading endonuclease toxin of MazEF toxin-antitoxin module
MPKPSVVNLDVLETIAKAELVDLITTLRPAKMRRVEGAIHFAVALQD